MCLVQLTPVDTVDTVTIVLCAVVIVLCAVAIVLCAVAIVLCAVTIVPGAVATFWRLHILHTNHLVVYTATILPYAH